MTGREAKILTGYGSFATQHVNPEEESTGILLMRKYAIIEFLFTFSCGREHAQKTFRY